MFQESLTRLVTGTEGGIAGLLMGFDGISVDSYVVPENPIALETIGMEFSFILSQVRKAAEILEIGGVHELTIRADKMTLMIRVLSSEYFLALVLVPDGNLGKGRYLLRTLGPRFQAEL